MNTDELHAYLERAANPTAFWTIPPEAARIALAKLRSIQKLEEAIEQWRAGGYSDALVDAWLDYRNAGKDSVTK